MPDHGSPDLVKWKILSRHTVYDYPPYLRLERQVLQLPDDRQINDYHWLKMPDYCLICPFTNDGAIVMLRAYRHGIGEITPHLPGGLVEEGEQPLNAAKRELLEETGYGSNNWRPMGSYVPHGNYGCGRVHIFAATNVSVAEKPNSGDLEEMSVEVIDLDTVYEWISSGRIQSLASVTAILLSSQDIF